MATQAQIDHITQHIDRFEDHAGNERTPAEYLREYAHIPDIYERLCHDLGLTPIPEEGTVSDQQIDLQTLVQSEIAKAIGSLSTAAPTAPASFEDALAAVDPADSEAALAMLDFLLRTGRLGRVGVLDGGQGYLFMYQEPKGSTKQGYTPGATQGDRIVDQAVEKQRAAGAKPTKTGMCPKCMSVVKEGPGGVIVLDDPDAEGVAICSAGGDHELV